MSYRTTLKKLKRPRSSSRLIRLQSGRLPCDIAQRKEQHRRELAKLSFDEKIAVLIRMQKIAREMAQAAGRKFNGVVWGERESENKSSQQGTEG